MLLSGYAWQLFGRLRATEEALAAMSNAFHEECNHTACLEAELAAECLARTGVESERDTAIAQRDVMHNQAQILRAEAAAGRQAVIDHQVMMGLARGATDDQVAEALGEIAEA